MTTLELTSYTDTDGEIVKYPKALAAIPFLTDDLMQASQVARVFSAATIEEAMQPQEKTDSLADYAGEVLIIHGCGLRPSNIDGRKGIFAIIDAEVAESGKTTVITTGAMQPMAVIARAMQDGKLPLTCRAYEAAPSVKGQNGQLFLHVPEAF